MDHPNENSPHWEEVGWRPPDHNQNIAWARLGNCWAHPGHMEYTARVQESRNVGLTLLDVWVWGCKWWKATKAMGEKMNAIEASGKGSSLSMRSAR